MDITEQQANTSNNVSVIISKTPSMNRNVGKSSLHVHLTGCMLKTPDEFNAGSNFFGSHTELFSCHGNTCENTMLRVGIENISRMQKVPKPRPTRPRMTSVFFLTGRSSEFSAGSSASKILLRMSYSVLYTTECQTQTLPSGRLRSIFSAVVISDMLACVSSLDLRDVACSTHFCGCRRLPIFRTDQNHSCTASGMPRRSYVVWRSLCYLRGTSSAV